MKLTLLFLLTLILSCGHESHEHEDESYSQYLLDNKEFLQVIERLKDKPLDSQNRQILTDAYIGASGFELLPFLSKLSSIHIYERAEDEHLFEYLEVLLRQFIVLSDIKIGYIEEALRILIKSIQEDPRVQKNKLKLGMLYIYKITNLIKIVGDEYSKKIVIDPANGKVVLLTPEEEAQLIMHFNKVLEYSYKAYMNLRESYVVIRGYFGSIDLAVKDIIGLSIEEVEEQLKKHPIKKVIEDILAKNPHILKELYRLLDKECDKHAIKRTLTLARDKALKDPGLKQFVALLNTLLAEIEKHETRVCNEDRP